MSAPSNEVTLKKVPDPPVNLTEDLEFLTKERRKLIWSDPSNEGFDGGFLIQNYTVYQQILGEEKLELAVVPDHYLMV